MNNLGYYHYTITKNYGEIKRLYRMAIERGDVIAMSNLAYYYKKLTKNCKEMVRLFKMAIEYGGDTDAIKILSDLYFEQNQKFQFIELLFLYPTTSDPPNWKDLLSACTYKVSLYTALEKVPANRWTQEVQAVLRNDPYVASFIQRRIISAKHNILDQCIYCLEENIQVVQDDHCQLCCATCYDNAH